MTSSVGDARLPRVGDAAGPRLGLFTVLTVLVLLPLAFVLTAGLGGIDDEPLRPVRQLLSDRVIIRVIGNTLLVATGVAIASTATGVVVALVVERTNARFAGLMHGLMLMPILVSPLVGTVAWITLGRPQTGFINLVWQALTGSNQHLLNIYSAGGMMFVISLHVAPYVYLNLRGALRNVDGGLEEAAMMLGSGLAHVWRRVTLPLIMPAILSSAILVFVLAMETFSVAALLGGPARVVTLAFNIYLAVELPPGDWNYAALQGMLLIAMTGLLMVGYSLSVGSGRKYATLSGKGFKAPSRASGLLASALIWISWCYLAIAVLLPTAALILQSLLAFTTSRIGDMAFSLDNWSRLIASTAFYHALVTTLLVGLVSATMATVIALFVAQISIFERAPVFDWLATLPLAFPGIVFGIALVFIYAGTPIYGTVWVLVLGFTTQFLPSATRALTGPMMQLDRGVDEAGKTLGAYMASRILKVSAPLVRVPLMTAWISCFTRSVRELNVAVFLATPATTVVSMLIWSYMSNGQSGLAAALSVLQMAILIAVVTVAERLTGTSARA